jgi:hypothetical protein
VIKAKHSFGIHYLIAAIKYLDGSTNGHDGYYTAAERRAAIYLMFDLLPKRVFLALYKDRQDYWEQK